VDAKGATADRRVVIAGPIGTGPISEEAIGTPVKPPLSCLWWTLPVGHMGSIVGSSAPVYVHYRLVNIERVGGF
jgi:hypothetical protein